MTTAPVLTFFNNKGGVGKTSLVYHLAWMLSGLGHRVLACDLDPQANLTAAFLPEIQLEGLWSSRNQVGSKGNTIYQCLKPLTEVGDVKDPSPVAIAPELSLIPGDLALAGYEDILSSVWPDALGTSNLFRPLRILTAFYWVMQQAAAGMNATVILADVGPNLGAINRAALIATDYVIVPLGADIFSLQGLRNLGPTLQSWRREWSMRRDNESFDGGFILPQGEMRPAGYVVQQHGVRLSRPVKAYDRWVNRMPKEYAKNLLGQDKQEYPSTPMEDPHCLATVKHYRSLVPMAQEVRKPVFELTPADGAIGSHATAVRAAYKNFRDLALQICKKTGTGLNS